MNKILSFALAIGIALGVFAFASGAATAGYVESYVTGRGLAKELVDEDKPYLKDSWRIITFAGFVGEFSSGDLIGKWLVNLNNVGDNALDNSRFRTTDITELNFFAPNSGTCTGATNLTAIGELNGIPDYKMIFRAGDDDDTIRVEIFDPANTKIYDSHAAGEFPDESSCVGTARTGLDAGKIMIVQ